MPAIIIHFPPLKVAKVLVIDFISALVLDNVIFHPPYYELLSSKSPEIQPSQATSPAAKPHPPFSETLPRTIGFGQHSVHRFKSPSAHIGTVYPAGGEGKGKREGAGRGARGTGRGAETGKKRNAEKRECENGEGFATVPVIRS